MAVSFLKFVRKSAGFLQKDFAERLGISSQYLSDLEHRRRKLTPDLADKLHEVLCNCDDSYDGSQTSRKQFHKWGARAAGWDV